MIQAPQAPVHFDEGLRRSRATIFIGIGDDPEGCPGRRVGMGGRGDWLLVGPVHAVAQQAKLRDVMAGDTFPKFLGLVDEGHQVSLIPGPDPGDLQNLGGHAAELPATWQSQGEKADDREVAGH